MGNIRNQTRRKSKAALPTVFDTSDMAHGIGGDEAQNYNFIKQAFEALPYPFYVVDTLNFTIKMANAATRAFGAIGAETTCYSLTHNRKDPCRGPEHICPLEEVKRSKKPVITEHTHYDAAGNARNHEVHCYPIFDGERNVPYMIEFSLDITERKRTEHALQESKKKYRYLAQTSLEGIMLHEDGLILEANKALEGISGFAAEELLGKQLFDIVSPDYVEIVRAKMMSSCEKPYEAELTRKDGSRVEVEIQAKSFSYQGKKARIMAIRDITDRRRRESDLNEQREMLLKIFEQAPIAIAVLREDGSFFFWNTALERITGYFRKELRRFSFENLISRDEVDSFRDKFIRLINRNWRNYRFQTKIIQKNGKILSTEIFYYRIVDRIKNTPLYVCFLQDLTERKESELKQRSLIAQMRHLYSELDEFSEIVNETKKEEHDAGAHDFGLSKTDDAIIGFIMQGYRNREIADELNLAEITIKKRVSNIYRKLGVTRRLELIEHCRSLSNA